MDSENAIFSELARMGWEVDNAMDTQVEPEQPSLERASAQFPLVGLGAAAGGLAALEALLPGLPARPGFAMVVIAHLAPLHASLDRASLQRCCKMPVVQVTQHPTLLQADHVYLIAPGTLLKVEDNYLFLDQVNASRTALGAIDYFFHSLALSHGAQAIGVLLSGIGSDGCSGLAALREQGASTIVQSPDDAQFGVLPQAAIDAGLADMALPAAAMAERLMMLCAALARAPEDGPFAGETQAVADVLRIVHQRTGHDFRHYKRPTVLRRLERRLHLQGMRSMAAYRELLKGDEQEAGRLLKDLLIGVTGFFRDTEAFQRLREVAPDLLRQAGARGELRVWVAACSTGQEAYSLAILLADLVRDVPEAPRIHIFASDIDEQALGIARAGLYPDSIRDDVPAATLERYFIRRGGSYRVRQDLREMITFASHNLLRDPPFSGLDLVSCRNLLIYLDRYIQLQVLQRFRFALNDGGFLFLGSAESADNAPELFERVAHASRIYQARIIHGRPSVPPPPGRPALLPPAAAIPPPAHGAGGALQASLDALRERQQRLEYNCEELQASNEGLSTINAELRARMEETGRANDDLNNLVASADLATVFVDPDLVVRRFTPRAAGIFSLMERDVGRSLLDLTNRLHYPQLAEDARQALRSPQAIEREVQGTDGRHYIARARAYRTGDEDVSGTVLTFFDISRRREAEDAARQLAEDQEFVLQLDNALRPLGEAQQVLAEGCRLLAQRLAVPRLAFAEIRLGQYRVLPGYANGAAPLQGEGAVEALGEPVVAAWRQGEVAAQAGPADASAAAPGGALDRIAGDGAWLAAVCRTGEQWLGFFVAAQPAGREWADADIALFEESAMRIGVERERARAQDALRASEAQLRHVLQDCSQACWQADAAGQVVQELPGWRSATGQHGSGVLGEGWLDAVHADDRPALRESWHQAVAGGVGLQRAIRLRGPGGGRRASLLATPQRDEQGVVQGWTGCIFALDGRAQPASGSI